MVSYHILSIGNALYTPEFRLIDGNTGNPTITLIISKGRSLLVDPGAGELADRMAEARKIKKSLANFLGKEEPDFIFVTHPHLDHCNFADAFQCGVVDRIGELLPGVFSFPTPGHYSEHKSLEFIAEKKNIVVAGDAVINRDYFYADNPLERVYTENDYNQKEIEQTLETMENIKKRADYIIPGHGEMFEVKK